MRCKLLTVGVLTTVVVSSGGGVALAAPSGPGTVCGVVSARGVAVSVKVTRGQVDCGVALQDGLRFLKGEGRTYDPVTDTFRYTVAGRECKTRKTPRQGQLPKSWVDCFDSSTSLRLDPYNPTNQPPGVKPCWQEVCRFV